MNYYPFHVGDYASATRHLSWDEDAAYRRLLDVYYTLERPIPADKVYRLTVATSKTQREAVATVLSAFFTKTPEGWFHEQCEKEIKAMRVKQARYDRRPTRVCKKYQRHREFVFNRDGVLCAYCGADDVVLQLDHVIPRARGGSDDPENLTPACKTCNTSKGSKLFSEWSRA